MPYEKQDNQNYHQSKYGNGNRDYQPKGQWQKPQGQEQEGNKPTRSSGYERLEAKIEEQSAQISHLVGLVERLTNQLLDNQNTKTNTKEQYNELKAEIAEENDNAMRHHR